MNWNEVHLGEAIHVKHGYAFKSKFFANEGEYIVLTPGNFYEDGGFKSRPGKDRYYSGNFPEEYILNKGDLIIAMTEQGPGLLGSSAWISKSDRFLHNQRLGLVQIIEDSLIDKRFLYHLFNTRIVRHQVQGSATGVKVKHTAPERIYRVKVDIPSSITDQRRISEVVDAYDNLIENNQRRIQLLEESTKLLYKEWFINLRFPGHEHIKITDGVPKGWKKKPLIESTDVKKGKNITRNTVKEGSIPVVAGGLNPAYYHNTPNVSGPVVTISASGANAGYANLYYTDIWASDCSYINEEAARSVYYTYLLLRSRQKDLFGMQKGAAQPHVYPKDIQRLEVLTPPSRFIEMFHNEIEGIFDMIAILRKQSGVLKKARDLLLPRLMNGEITV